MNPVSIGVTAMGSLILADFRAEFKAKAKTDSKVNAKADLELDFETESSTAEIVADMSQRTGINKDQNLLPALDGRVRISG